MEIAAVQGSYLYFLVGFFLQRRSLVQIKIITQDTPLSNFSNKNEQPQDENLWQCLQYYFKSVWMTLHRDGQWLEAKSLLQLQLKPVMKTGTVDGSSQSVV